MGQVMVRMYDRLAAWVARRRALLRGSEGFTLVELVIGMAVMLIVLAPLTQSFTSALRTEADQTRRFDAQENARQALERMRKDIHCAHGVGINTSEDADGQTIGQTIVLTETHVPGEPPECPGLIESNASAVQWCTVQISASRYQLFRENNPDNTCDGQESTFMVDYLTEAELWSDVTCAQGEYPTVAVTLPVNVDPVAHAPSTYTLNDQIALRNGDACS